MPSVTNNYESLSKEDLVRLLVERDQDTEANPHKKKYGLIWEDKPEQFEADSIGRIPVLKRDPNKCVQTDSSKPTHVLIQGDNYHALKVLTYTHERSVDVIYIDPPYNTGNNDFRYNDKYVDKDDGYRHSKWLSFMDKRLRLAKALLKQDGFIAVSINDRELFNLKLLLDSIFGEDNFINNIAVKASELAGVKMSHVAGGNKCPQVKESLLIYAKSKPHLRLRIPKTAKEKWDSEYKLFADGLTEKDRGVLRGMEARAVSLSELAAADAALSRVKLIPLREAMARLGVPKAQVDKFQFDNAWRICRTIASPTLTPLAREKRTASDQELFAVRTKRDGTFYVCTGNFNLNVENPRCAIYFADSNLQQYVSDIWTDVPTTGLGTEMPPGIAPFKNGQKPLKLLERIISLHADDQPTVLDFFAGSGTTAHAVLNLNARDGRHRQCLLATNDEGEFKDEAGRILPGGICTNVTHPRVRKVLEGYQTPAGKAVPPIAENLAFFVTEFVEDRAIERYRRELSARSVEMLCLRESCFIEEKSDDKRWRSFTDSRGKRLVVVIDPYAAEEIRPILRKDTRATVLYAFRFDEDDEPAREYGGQGLEHVTAKPIPDSILALHRRLAKQH